MEADGLRWSFPSKAWRYLPTQLLAQSANACSEVVEAYFSVWTNVEIRLRAKESVTPLHPCLGRPLPAVSDFCIQIQIKINKKKSFIGTCEGWHVHESPLRSSIIVVLIVYYSPCTAVFLQIWFTVSLIL